MVTEADGPGPVYVVFSPGDRPVAVFLTEREAHQHTAAGTRKVYRYVPDGGAEPDEGDVGVKYVWECSWDVDSGGPVAVRGKPVHPSVPPLYVRASDRSVVVRGKDPKWVLDTAGRLVAEVRRRLVSEV